MADAPFSLLALPRAGAGPALAAAARAARAAPSDAQAASTALALAARGLRAERLAAQPGPADRQLTSPHPPPPHSPKGYHASCYATGAKRALTFGEAWRSGPSIDFLCLTVDFGSILKTALSKRGLRAYEGSPTPRAVAEEAVEPRASKATVTPLA